MSRRNIPSNSGVDIPSETSGFVPVEQLATAGSVLTTIGGTATTTTTGGWLGSAVQFASDAGARVVQRRREDGSISAKLYFSYIKSKFNIIDRIRIDRRMKLLEKAFNKAVDAGQDMLSEKMLNEISRFMRETMLLQKGIKYQISKEEVAKYKRRIKNGHISDTKLEKFTRAIPEKVVKRLNEVRSLFDSFVIYHYWSDAAQSENVKKMNSTEHANMRDPVLFGQFNEAPNVLYFIADWEDEFCDLTFDEMLEAMGRNHSDVLLNNQVDLTVRGQAS